MRSEHLLFFPVAARFFGIVERRRAHRRDSPADGVDRPHRSASIALPAQNVYPPLFQQGIEVAAVLQGIARQPGDLRQLALPHRPVLAERLLDPPDARRIALPALQPGTRQVLTGSASVQGAITTVRIALPGTDMDQMQRPQLFEITAEDQGFPADTGGQGNRLDIQVRLRGEGSQDSLHAGT